MKIVELNEKNTYLMSTLVKTNHLIFHTPRYKKFIEEAFNCHYKLLAAVKDEEVKTIFPIVEIKNKLLGNKVISSAYLEYGGFAGSPKYFKEIISYVNKEYGKDFNYLEIRGGLEENNLFMLSIPNLIKKDLYKRFVLKLDNEENVWRGIQKSKRKAVKKALKQVDVKEVPLTDLDEFYNLYCDNMRQFGSPSYAKKYFKSFYQNLIKQKLGKIYGSYHQGKLVSALVGFCYKGRVHILIAISDSDFQELRPNDAMHWEFIKWAINNKYQYFDFGRVREDSGQFEFKRKWGAELKELPSYFMLWNEKEIPVVDPTSKKYRLFIQLWKITPLWVTKLLGPWLRKGLGI